MTRFSVCIPNFNYERFLGRTIQSALDQDETDLEIVVADNASTDESVAVAASFGDKRIRIHQNACNVGFARNLDQAALQAGGTSMVMLSSDDLMHADALRTYATLLDRIGEPPAQIVLSYALGRDRPRR